MQDNWCGEEMPMPGNCHSNWEEEEEVEIGMWNNNTSSQEANQSGNWSYMKKMPPKVRNTIAGILLFFPLINTHFVQDLYV